MNKYPKYVKPYKKCFILGPICMVLEAVGEVFLPYMTADIINTGAANNDISYILKVGALMIVIAIGMIVFGVLGVYFSVNGASNMAAEMREDTFKQIQKYSFRNIDEFSPSSLITRLTNDVNQIQTFVMTALRTAFRSPVMLVGAVIMAFMLDRQLATLLIIIIPVLAFCIYLILAKASPQYTKMQSALDDVNANTQESLTNMRVVKSFVREDYEEKKFSKVNDRLQAQSVKALKIMILQQPISTMIMNLTTLLIVWIAGRQIMIGGMQIGTLTAFVTYITQILSSLNMLANIFLQGSRAIASDKRISEVLEVKLDLTDAAAKRKDKIVEEGKIVFEHVNFRYYKNNPRKVLDDISFTIRPGETIGIIGSTGSGKSTLIQLIERLYDVDEGAIYVDNVNVKDYSTEHLRDGIGIVLQKNTLFSGTVSENLRWGNETATDEELVAAAKIAQADSFISAMANGYETELDQGGVNLSGGQKQRLCLARTILKHPKILILDDSTSAVDTATDTQIRAALYHELKGMTKLIIAQRISSVIEADEIMVINEGKIAGYGRHEDLIKNCIPYQEIYYSQIEKKGAETV